jgi:hypothetical protein
MENIKKDEQCESLEVSKPEMKEVITYIADLCCPGCRDVMEG